MQSKFGIYGISGNLSLQIRVDLVVMVVVVVVVVVVAVIRVLLLYFVVFKKLQQKARHAIK